jgi:Flp pilus assembly protein TadG
MKDESGSISLWLLGLSVLLLAFGGLAIDYWRALALQRDLAAVADSVAVAAASGLDETHYRETGQVRLEEGRVVALAGRALDAQGVSLTGVDVSVSADGSTVTVTVSAAVDLGLLAVLVDDDRPLEVSATATAYPVRLP